MMPLWPNLYVLGDARRIAGPPLRVRGAEPAEAAAVETAWSGVDRGADYDRWARLQGGRPWIAEDAGGRLAAVGLDRRRRRGDGRWLIRLVVAPDADPIESMLAGIAASADDEGRIGTCLPGPSPVLRPLLEAGFRIVDRDTYMASEPGLLDPDRMIVDTGIP
jgi:hypothetical protein